MKQSLVALLATFGYPVFLQGSLNKDDAYPASFFTFWNDETDGAAFYDNDANTFVWTFTVYFYSTDPALVNTTLISVRSLLRSNGWIVPGLGYDVASDEITHTGRAIDVLYEQQNIYQEDTNNGNQHE